MRPTQSQDDGSSPVGRSWRSTVPIVLVALVTLTGLFGALLAVSTSRAKASGPGVANASTIAAHSPSSPSSPASPASPASSSSSTTTRPKSSVSTAPVSPLSNPGSSAPSGPGPSAADLADVHAMLVNEEEHGWDSCYNGLYINWNDTNGTTVGNWNGGGQPDPTPCTRHEDRMTTLRFLDGLLLYKADSGTTEFDTEISQIEAHVLTLFSTGSPDPRGWAYDTVLQIAGLSANPQFTAIATSMLHLYSTRPADNTRPDWQFEEASALVQSGVPSYVAQGTAELTSYWNADYLPSLGLINEPNGIIVTSDQGDIATALARAGFTAQANQLLSGVQTHLWDAQNGGFGEGAVYSNGSLTPKMKKTGGRMMNMMELGKVLGNAGLVSTMDGLFQQHIYQSSPEGYEGVLYEQRPDWTPYILGGTTENWVTSEAIGITAIALLSPN